MWNSLSAPAPATTDFARDGQPIFQDHSVDCHGPSPQTRRLRPDRRRDVVHNRVGANGARIVPGSSARSPLFRRASPTETAQVMPTTGALAAAKVQILKTWIEQ